MDFNILIIKYNYFIVVLFYHLDNLLCKYFWMDLFIKAGSEFLLKVSDNNDKFFFIF